jgi:hypothetical protein
MKNMRSNIILVALMVCCLGLVFGCPSWAVDDLIIVMGKMDANGSLTTEKGEIYWLETDDRGKEVISHTPKCVIITGRLKEKEGKQMITVSTFQVVEKTAGQEEPES